MDYLFRPDFCRLCKRNFFFVPRRFHQTFCSIFHVTGGSLHHIAHTIDQTHQHTHILCELDFGSFEGKTYEQLKDNPAYRKWIDTAGKTAPPGGESGAEFSQRLLGAMRQIADDAVNRNLRCAAVVTHGGCIMTLLSTLHPLAESRAGGMDMYDFQAPNGGGYRMEMDTETLRLDQIRSL